MSDLLWTIYIAGVIKGVNVAASVILTVSVITLIFVMCAALTEGDFEDRVREVIVSSAVSAVMAIFLILSPSQEATKAFIAVRIGDTAIDIASDVPEVKRARVIINRWLDEQESDTTKGKSDENN